MKSLQILAEAIPPLKKIDHYENLKHVHSKNAWVSVLEYIEIVYDLSVAQNPTKKFRLLRRLKNALK
jgi:hypothetical protein